MTMLLQTTDVIVNSTTETAPLLCCDQLLISILVPILCAVITVVIIIIIVKMRQKRASGVPAATQHENGSSIELPALQASSNQPSPASSEHQQDPDYADIRDFHTHLNSSPLRPAEQLHRQQNPLPAPQYALVAPAPSHRMTIQELIDLLSTEEGINQLNDDFKNLPDQSDKDQMKDGDKPENQSKNAHGDLLPYDFNRVLLSKTVNQPSSDYINASKISLIRNYIAAQAPLDGTRRDFWRMIIEKNVRVIVNLHKSNKDENRFCSRYWPTDNNQVDEYEGFSVQKAQENDNSEFIEYCLTYEVQDECVTRGNVILLHFDKWPSNGVPASMDAVLKLRHRLCELTQPDDVVVVHDGAGAGQTGTFIALDTLLSACEKTGSVDVLRCVFRLRTARPQMVQTLEQYLFLHRCIVQEFIAIKDND